MLNAALVGLNARCAGQATQPDRLRPTSAMATPKTRHQRTQRASVKLPVELEKTRASTWQGRVRPVSALWNEFGMSLQSWSPACRRWAESCRPARDRRSRSSTISCAIAHRLRPCERIESEDGAVVFRAACGMGRHRRQAARQRYHSSRSRDWIKIEHGAPAIERAMLTGRLRRDET
jgi:hypothetical protein